MNTLEKLSSFFLFVTLWFYTGCANNDEPKPVDCNTSDLTIVVTNKTNPTNCDSNNGSIEVEATGGKPAYQFAIGSGGFSSSIVFTNLSGGSFSITVKDANSCTKLINVSLTTPAGPVATVPQIENDTKCLAPHNGAISIDATGGTGTYQFKLDNGAFGASGSFASIAAGNHTITIKDEANCSIAVNVTVPKGNTNTTYTADIFPILQAKCQFAGCHPTNGDWFIYSTAKSNAAKIKTKTGDKSMPKGGAGAPGGALSDDQISLIACWADGGALE